MVIAAAEHVTESHAAALLVPLLRTRRDVAVAAGAAVLALVSSWLVPPGLPVLLAALAAVPAALRSS
ncbi:putative branched-subunit amino acid permease [Streptosporangium album]|uniref:Putative branched-subunit amino acid permease n=1 Tax=Streptosporangium album TaxID=47479 RepID=A0A7W7S1B7_9ACTN|nr:hypothetical protein [Streptosporangium album]MBB4942109.1 putative branched-subunit amino acid permease [Streptosporangium album]